MTIPLLSSKLPSMKDAYTPTEVGALIESLRSDFRLVSEGLLALRKDMDDVKERLSKLETRVQRLEDAVRVSLPSITVRLTNLEAKVGV